MKINKTPVRKDRGFIIIGGNILVLTVSVVLIISAEFNPHSKKGSDRLT